MKIRAPVAVGLIVVSVAVWAAPTVLYGMQLWWQFIHGYFHPLVLLFGPIEFALGLALSVIPPIRFLRQGRVSDAISTSIVSLVVGIPFAGWGVLMFGST